MSLSYWDECENPEHEGPTQRGPYVIGCTDCVEEQADGDPNAYDSWNVR